MLRQFAAARSGKPRLPLSFGEWCVDLPVVMRLIRSRPRGEVGQLTKKHVQLHGAALHRNLLAALTPRRIDRRAQQSQRLPWVGIRDHDRCGDEFAALEDYALGRYYPCDRDAGSDHRSRLSRGIAKVERDHAHAAFCIPPHAGHSAQAARRMMEADAGGSRVERAGISPNYALPEVRSLQPFVTQIVFNELGHRPVEEHVPCLLIFPEPPFNLFLGGRLADPQLSITFWTQRIAQSAEHITHRAPSFHIPRSEAANLGLAPLVTIPELNAGAVVEWDKQSIQCRCPLKAALRYAQL